MTWTMSVRRGSRCRNDSHCGRGRQASCLGRGSLVRGKLRGLPLPEPWRSAPMADQPDLPFESSRGDAVADVAFVDKRAQKQRAAGRYEFLDAVAAVVSFGQSLVTLRWLLVHMIEETE